MPSTERTRIWGELIAAWQSSGQSGQAFCKTQVDTQGFASDIAEELEV